ncbi:MULTISPECIES: type II secretion system protein [Streptococcus]|uniref:PilD-dependent protein pddA n=1 Tax=Streptococcus sanguinis TaxID=1305 RepID=A0A2X3YAP3_STRSA|nr:MULTISPECIES: prepilin-type N-terminal cleavage/methylation domain-containing protein [Streptococcus]NMH33561.1 prepilin-type N-terminal cleavage/methylation domain-containing protein [Streptococcus sanguinis]RSH97423.1 Type II secretion system protein G precursor [Streptococcus sanguinis]RSI08971.1 Type II secretion system protein G precursor [Streptococcus sanguinis]RSI27614.1 Type II secretion system protein G precursor [Streptococcus sanguinis]RSI30119.1 Type II secretion system protein
MLNKLQEFRRNLKKKSKGFTLVELIVVIIIIAIITAVAVPALTSFQDNARRSRIQSEHRELATAIQSYIGSQDDPETVKSITMEQLAPYISKNSKGDSAKIMDALAKNDTEPAHKIDGTTLVSTFHPSGVGTDKTKDKTWLYDWRYSGSNTN